MCGGLDVVMVSRYTFSSKLFKLFTFIMYSFLCVNHTSVKWF